MHNSFQCYRNDTQTQNYLLKFPVMKLNFGEVKLKDILFFFKKDLQVLKPYLSLNLLVILFNHVNEFNLLKMQ